MLFFRSVLHRLDRTSARRISDMPAPANKPRLNLTETDATAGSSPLINGLVSTLTNYDVFGRIVGWCDRVGDRYCSVGRGE